ncbi:MAG: class I SAM-dependent methyltransferase [Acidimicrobiia bacterium]
MVDPVGATLEAVPCALCGSRDADPARVRAPREEHASAMGLPGGRSQWVVCRSCGLVFQSPRPRSETLAALYDGAYHEIRGGVPEHYLQYSLRRSRGAIAWGLAQMEANGTSGAGRALDIGCGIGGALVLLRDRGWSVTGIEADRELTDVGRTRFGLDIHNELFDDTSFGPTESFDFAYNCHVWEHLPDPVATTAAAASVLRPDQGYLLIVVPTFRRARTNAWACFTAPHTYMFTDVSLRRLLEGAGLAPVAFRYAAGADSELWMLARAQPSVGTPGSDRDDPDRVQRELARVPLRAPLGLPGRLATHAGTLLADPGDFARRAGRGIAARARRARAALPGG